MAWFSLKSIWKWSNNFNQIIYFLLKMKICGNKIKNKNFNKNKIEPIFKRFLKLYQSPVQDFPQKSKTFHPPDFSTVLRRLGRWARVESFLPPSPSPIKSYKNVHIIASSCGINPSQVAPRVSTCVSKSSHIHTHTHTRESFAFLSGSVFLFFFFLGSKDLFVHWILFRGFSECVIRSCWLIVDFWFYSEE